MSETGNTMSGEFPCSPYVNQRLQWQVVSRQSTNNIFAMPCPALKTKHTRSL